MSCNLAGVSHKVSCITYGTPQVENRLSYNTWNVAAAAPLVVISKTHFFRWLGQCTGWVAKQDGIIQAVRKHIVAKQTLAGGDEGIGIDESAPGGIVITALEIVQP